MMPQRLWSVIYPQSVNNDTDSPASYVQSPLLVSTCQMPGGGYSTQYLQQTQQVRSISDVQEVCTAVSLNAPLASLQHACA